MTASERMRLYFSAVCEYTVFIGRYPGGCVVFKARDVRNLAHSIVAYINCYQQRKRSTNRLMQIGH